jgi:predicted  nucleic acid-binding Zn-ribbon protein
MSTGDWFTLRPLNTTNYQPQIDELNSRLTGLTQRVDNMQVLLEMLQDQTNMIGAAVDNMRIQLTDLKNTVIQLNNTVN